MARHGPARHTNPLHPHEPGASYKPSGAGARAGRWRAERGAWPLEQVFDAAPATAAHGDGHSDHVSNADANVDPDEYCHSHADAYPNQFTDSFAYFHTYANLHAVEYAYIDPHPDLHAIAHIYAVEYSDSHLDPVEHTNPHTDLHPPTASASGTPIPKHLQLRRHRDHPVLAALSRRLPLRSAWRQPDRLDGRRCIQRRCRSIHLPWAQRRQRVQPECARRECRWRFVARLGPRSHRAVADRYADVDLHAHPYADSDDHANKYAHTHANVYSDLHTLTNIHAHLYPNIHAHNDTDLHPLTDSYVYAYPHSHFHPDEYPETDEATHPAASAADQHAKTNL